MKVSEIFTSIQGESTYCGFPCTFIRVTGCNLRCKYCDTSYAFAGGEEWTVEHIVNRVREGGITLVELTGGEPLLQEESYELMKLLHEGGYTVLLETNGSVSLEKVTDGIIKIVDFKCPSSGMSAHMDISNLDFLNRNDEVKFVIGTREDFDWVREMVERYKLINKCTVLLSPVFPILEPSELAHWLLEEKLPVRLQLQLHRFIWPQLTRGV